MKYFLCIVLFTGCGTESTCELFSNDEYCQDECELFLEESPNPLSDIQFPGGLCTRKCYELTDDCPVDYTCVNSGLDYGYCAEPCDDDSHCREGWYCARGILFQGCWPK